MQGGEYHRRSIRLKDYDYSQDGLYFVTICARDRECLFGEIRNEEMRLNELGRIVNNFWYSIKTYFITVDLDEFAVMPNHIHGIIVIGRGGVIPPTDNVVTIDGRGGVIPPEKRIQGGEIPCVKGGETPPLREVQIKPTLGQIIGYCKYQTTKIINQYLNLPPNKIWQRNYYEHIIRTDRSLCNITNYIYYNPAAWENDVENINVGGDISEDKSKIITTR